jgi:hypothetical protein
LKSTTGESIGSVTCQKRCTAPAPSMLAASYSSSGTPCSPARKMIMRLPPTEPQSAISTTEGIAHSALPSQRGPATPTRPSR